MEPQCDNTQLQYRLCIACCNAEGNGELREEEGAGFGPTI